MRVCKTDKHFSALLIGLVFISFCNSITLPALQRFDMLALTDFRHASHRLQDCSSRLVARNISNPGDEFGSALAALGDIDGDGDLEIAVGAPNSKQGCGSVYIFRITKSSDAELLSSHDLVVNATASRCVEALGLVGFSWVGDTTKKRHAVVGSGAPNYDSRGAVLLSFINENGAVAKEPRVLQVPHLLKNSLFGTSLVHVGDIDDDGTSDLIIGAPGESSIYLTFLADDGTLISFMKRQSSHGRNHGFGTSMAFLGDVDTDGRLELLVASKKRVELIFVTKHGFSDDCIILKLPKVVTRQLKRGSAISFIGLDDDDNIIFAIGNRYDNDGGHEKGAVWIITMEVDGHVRNCDKLSQTQGAFPATLGEREHFGASLAPSFDSNKDGFAELLIGAPWPSFTRVTKKSKLTTVHHHRGGVWITSIPGTRAKKVTHLDLSDSPAGCVYQKFKCTCIYGSGSRSICLSFATMKEDGAYCNVRTCRDAYRCDCRGRELCRIERASNSVFKRRNTEIPFSVDPNDPSLAPCAESETTMEFLSIQG